MHISSICWIISLLNLSTILAIFIRASYRRKALNNGRFLVCIALTVVLGFEMFREMLVFYRGVPFPLTGLRIYILRAEHLVLGAFCMEVWNDIKKYH